MQEKRAACSTHGKPQGRIRAWLKVVLIFPVIVCVLLLAAWAALALVPLPAGLFTSQDQTIEFVDRHGLPLRIEPADGELFSQRVPYSEIPLPLVHATIAAEDRRFWQHPGVDCRASIRAAWQLLANRRIISGASTITQQLIKLSHPRRRTFSNKLIEAVQALRLEQVWSKERILSEYLNRIEYGNSTRGCSAAARFYFRKPLTDLSAAECAFLAGLPQAPTRLNPHRNFARARKRQQWILERMDLCGWLNADEFERARAEELRLTPPHRVFEAPHFIDLLLEQRLAGLRMQSASSQQQPGIGAGALPSVVRVKTSLDLELNRFVETTLRNQLSLLASKQARNGAVVILDNRGGQVLALVGSQDYFEPQAGQVNGAWSPRSAGSTFKPFTYLLALENGATAASIVADVPTEFPTSTGLFAPLNYNRHCSGPVRYRMALANSLNIPAVKVLETVGGPEALMRILKDCGLSTLNESAEFYGLGLTIGNAEARLLELANAYACLARLGEFKSWQLLYSETAGAGRRVADRDAAYIIADILSDNEARTMAFGPDSALRFDFPVACKTGTSSNFRDNWAFGYTPEFTVGVWVGNFDGSPMRNVSGVSGAAPILHEVFNQLHARYGTSWYDVPATITEVWIDPLTGKRLPPGDEARPRVSGKAKEIFVRSVLPPLAEPGDYDATGRLRLGNEYRDWLAGPDNWLAGRAVLAGDTRALRIVFPLPGTTFYLDPDLPEGGRRLHLQAAGTEDPRWSSDSLECRKEGSQSFALLSAGRHQLAVRDPRTGLQAATWITVLAR